MMNTTQQINEYLKQRDLKPLRTIRKKKYYSDGKDQIIIRLSSPSDPSNALATRNRMEQEACAIGNELPRVVNIEWRGILASTYFSNTSPTYVEIIFKE
jgi:hypothetical protein